jgi:UDP-perosamine 4-acetyltransferase
LGGPGGYDRAVSSSKPRQVLLFGAGGHARVCVDALLDMGDADIVGAVSSDGSAVAGLAVRPIWADSDLLYATQSSGANAFCVAIGDNESRRRVSTDLTQSGWIITQAISGSSVVSRSAILGSGVQVIAGAIINAATTIGAGTIVNTGASVDHDCTIGDFVHIGPGAVLGGAVTVGDGAFVGLGARVLPGVSIGAGATVGAGAVVIADVEPGATVVGVPARPIERRSKP